MDKFDRLQERLNRGIGQRFRKALRDHHAYCAEARRQFNSEPLRHFLMHWGTPVERIIVMDPKWAPKP